MLSPVTLSQQSGITPRRLILELLDADAALMGHTPRLLSAGEVFAFSHNQMRVALSRLRADDLLTSPERGRYALSGTGAAMRDEVQRWHHLEDQLQHWRGDWCALVTENLAAESSKQFRAQTRALRLRGMQRWRPGIWVRPNNLHGGLQQLVEDVTTLGLDSLAGSYLMADTDEECQNDLRALWDTDAIRAGYQQRISKLNAAIERLDDPDQIPVLKETLELGGGIIRALLNDPLLPGDMSGGDSLPSLIALMKHYDAAGRVRWKHFFDHLTKAHES